MGLVARLGALKRTGAQDISPTDSQQNILKLALIHMPRGLDLLTMGRSASENLNVLAVADDSSSRISEFPKKIANSLFSLLHLSAVNYWGY